MRQTKEVKVWKQGDSLVMVIPAIFIEELEITPGDYLTVQEKQGKIIAEKSAFQFGEEAKAKLKGAR